MKFNWNKTLNNFNKTPVTIFKPDIGTSTWALESPTQLITLMRQKQIKIKNQIPQEFAQPKILN